MWELLSLKGNLGLCCWKNFCDIFQALINRPLHNAPLPAVSSAPFGESGKRPKKMAAAESKSTLNLLPEDLSLLCFGQSPSILK